MRKRQGRRYGRRWQRRSACGARGETRRMGDSPAESLWPDRWPRRSSFSKPSHDLQVANRFLERAGAEAEESAARLGKLIDCPAARSPAQRLRRKGPCAKILLFENLHRFRRTPAKVDRKST